MLSNVQHHSTLHCGLYVNACCSAHETGFLWHILSAVLVLKVKVWMAGAGMQVWLLGDVDHAGIVRMNSFAAS